MFLHSDDRCQAAFFIKRRLTVGVSAIILSIVRAPSAFVLMMICSVDELEDIRRGTFSPAGVSSFSPLIFPIIPPNKLPVLVAEMVKAAHPKLSRDFEELVYPSTVSSWQ